MRAFVQDRVGHFEERDLPRPRAGPGEVVLRMRAALTCGTDLKILARGHARIRPPLTMGHELSGEIAEVGAGVTAWKAGERVVPGISGPCGRCADCHAGRANLCAAGHADRMWGAFAEYVLVPASVVAANLHRLPESLEDEAAAFVDPLASVLHGWNRLRAPAGTLLVYGAGALGFLWAAVA
ncbi:MAG: alcohol dehydrogenase catalytic domain-containing protein, partial [Thermoanaerobaculia bacterium]